MSENVSALLQDSDSLMNLFTHKNITLTKATNWHVHKRTLNICSLSDRVHYNAISLTAGLNFVVQSNRAVEAIPTSVIR